MPGKLTSLLLGAVLLPTAASAERHNPLANQPSIRHRVELRRLRFEASPQFLVAINQDFRHFAGAGLVLQFHFNDWLGLGIQGGGGAAFDTGLTSQLNTRLDPTAARGLQPSRQQSDAHLASVQAMFAGYLTLTPVAGKLMVVGALLLKYDLYAMLGGGGLLFSNSFRPGIDGNAEACAAGDPNQCDPQNAGLKGAALIGVGAHVYFNQWLGLNLELRDMITTTNPTGLDTNGDRTVTSADETLSSSLFFGAGLTFMLPPTAAVSP